MTYNADSQRLDDISDELLRMIWASTPVTSTLLGIHDHDDTLGDLSAESFEQQCRSYAKAISALQTQIDPSSLPREKELDYHMAISLASCGMVYTERYQYWKFEPSYYLSTCIWGCFSLLVRESSPSDDAVNSIYHRMREIPGVLAAGRRNIMESPRVHIQIAIDVARAGKTYFRQVVPKLAEIVPSLAHDLRAANDAAIAAFEEYERWLRDRLLPSANERYAAGNTVYSQLLFAEHQLTYDPGDLVSLAEGLYAETNDRLAEIAVQIDPSRTWQELVQRLKDDHPPKEGLVDAYRRATRLAREFVVSHDLVTIPEDESLEITETPAFERCTLPYGAYFPPAPFGTRKDAYFWVTAIDGDLPAEEQENRLRGHCTYSIPVIALHETYPGHHLQLSRLVDLKSPLAKQMNSTLFSEGWALYSEQMMYEQGFYTDPRMRLFQLKELLWRVCRVIVDVGLHVGGMTIDEATQLLVDRAHMDRPGALAEVKRYAMTPTQPMTYVIGMLLLQDLRQRMERKLGKEFTLKAFHDRVLSYGSLPVALISQDMLARSDAEYRAEMRRSA